MNANIRKLSSVRPFSRRYGAVGIACAFLISLLACEPSSRSLASTEQNLLKAPEVRLQTVTLATHQFDVMVAFYNEILGFKVDQVSEDYATFADTTIAITTRESMQENSHHDPFLSPAANLSIELAFEVGSPADVDGFYEFAKTNNVRVISPPEDKFWGQRVAFFADPDGNVFDIFATLQ